MSELRWKKSGKWEFSRDEQSAWTAQGRYIGYVITRRGPADNSAWTLWIRQADGTLMFSRIGNRLGALKKYAAAIEEGAASHV